MTDIVAPRHCGPNQAQRQLLKEREDMTALQLPPDDYIAFRVDAVNLEN